MKLTFLSGVGRLQKLCKQLGFPGGDKAYPKCKTFISETVEVENTPEGLEQYEKYLKEYAEKGFAMLKGEMRRGDLNRESRVGATDKFTKTEHLVIDIDGFKMAHYCKGPQTQQSMKVIAEGIVALLPPCFSNVSYIAAASASLGIKSQVSMHLHFFLDKEYAPARLKQYLRYLNIAVEQISSQLTLNATCKQCKDIIDPCVADNSRIIYIAPPQFYDEEQNPIANDDRIILIKKGQHALDLSQALQDAHPQMIEDKYRARVKQLCDEGGIKFRESKTKALKTEMGEIQVVTNPARMEIEYTYDDGEYCHFNINGGDSNAYWCYCNDPRIMYNFKGEEPFLIEEANPEIYQWLQKKFHDKRGSRRAMVAHDEQKDCYYKVMWNDSTNEIISCNPSKKESLEDWLNERGEIMPDIIPTWEITFNPQHNQALDHEKRVINSFREKDIWKTNAKIPASVFELADGRLGYGYAQTLSQVAPNLYNWMYHMTGSNPACFEEFFNWLAFCLKYREKTQVAWMLSGTTGIGKGAFAEFVLRELFESKYVPVIGSQTLESQENSQLAEAIFCVMDEVKIHNNTKGQMLMERIKNLISDATIPFKKLYQNHTIARSYTNWLFFTNNPDAMKLADNDRRFSIAEPQLIPIKKIYPEFMSTGHKQLVKQELPILVEFIRQFRVNKEQAQTPLVNEAKARMSEAASNQEDNFITFIKTGELERIDEIIHDIPQSPVTQTARPIVLRLLHEWISNANEGEIFVAKHDLHALYKYMVNKDVNLMQFGRVMKRTGRIEKKIRAKDGLRVRGYMIKFAMDVDDKNAYVEHLDNVSGHNILAANSALPDLETPDE